MANKRKELCTRIAAMMLFANSPSIDASLINYYKTEYFKEWNFARKNGIRLTAHDIRVRLGIM